VTNWLAVDGEPAICERRPVVIPLVDKTCTSFETALSCHP
jgi:hypothetical protein